LLTDFVWCNGDREEEDKKPESSKSLPRMSTDGSELNLPHTIPEYLQIGDLKYRIGKSKEPSTVSPDRHNTIE